MKIIFNFIVGLEIILFITSCTEKKYSYVEVIKEKDLFEKSFIEIHGISPFQKDGFEVFGVPPFIISTYSPKVSIIHPIYFLCDVFTFCCFTIAYCMVVSIF